MKRLNKKGYEVSHIAGIAITFLVIAIILGFGGNIVDDLQDDVQLTSSETLNNETITAGADENATVNLGACRSQNQVSYTLTGWMNSTGVDGSADTHATAALNDTDGTINSDGQFLMSLEMSESGFGGQTVNLTYTCGYSDGNAAYNSTVFGLDSVEEFSSWLPTLALIIIAAVIIGIIVRYFAFSR